MLLPDCIIYSDGSSGADRSGGYAVLVATPHWGLELWGYAKDTTNNRMELFAAIKGMQVLDGPHDIKLVSDSAYMLNSIKHKWYEEWLGQGLSRKNMDLWLAMSKLLCYHTVTPIKVKGHTGVEHNERVDKLASQARVNQDEGVSILYGNFVGG